GEVSDPVLLDEDRRRPRPARFRAVGQGLEADAGPPAARREGRKHQSARECAENDEETHVNLLRIACGSYTAGGREGPVSGPWEPPWARPSGAGRRRIASTGAATRRRTPPRARCPKLRRT